MRDVKKELRERDQQIDDLLETGRRQADEIRRLKARIAELEAALGQRKEANTSKPPKFSATTASANKRNNVPAAARRSLPAAGPTL